LIKFNTHATPVAVAGKLTSTPAITRLSGATFESYHESSGLRRVLTYILNEGINGTCPPLASTKMIAFGSHGKGQLVDRGYDPEDIAILPPAGIESRFAPPENKETHRKRLGVGESETVILYVGRLTEMKGMQFLSEVIDDVTGRMNARFLLIGDGPLRQKLRDRFEESVIAPGKIPYSDIDQYYKAADLYVHPSKYEGVPLVVLEALSTGLPVIARRAGDIPSVTPNIVTTPEEMSQMILDGDYSGEWLNRHRFSEEYQKRVLTELFDSVTDRA